QGGLLLGPSFLGKISDLATELYPFKSMVMLDTVAVFGSMFYFFLIGVQLDPWILKKIEIRDVFVGSSAVLLSVVFAVPFSFLMHAEKQYLGIDISPSMLTVAAAFSVIGFPTIAHYLTELQMVNSEVGRRALASSIVSNVFGFGVVVATILANHSGETTPPLSYKKFLSGLAFVLVIAFGIRPLIVKALDLNIFFGPLLYGIAIPAGPPLGSTLMEKLDCIITWLFMPLYFVKTGLVTDIFAVKFRNYLVLQSIVLLSCTGKFAGAVLCSVYSGMPFPEAARIGLVMNVQGVLELGMYKVLRQNQALQEEPWHVLCLSVLLITGGVTPVLRYLHGLSRKLALRKRKSMMDLRPNEGLRLVVCVHQHEDVHPITHLVETLNPSKLSPVDVCLLHLLELTGRSHPILIAHKLNSVKSKKASSSKSIVNVFGLLQQRNHGTVVVHPFTSICSPSTMHDQVHEMAIERRATLIVVPFRRRTSEQTTRMDIDKILQLAPCTVGIIVDRGATQHGGGAFGIESINEPLESIAVFFIGGCDDREALAIGARMVGRRNILLTVIRLHSKGDETGTTDFENGDEKMMDGRFFNGIRSQIAANPRVTYTEYVAEDATGTVSVIQSIEDQFELIIVGRCHDNASPLIMGLSDWEEDAELGAVGNMFASSDSNSKSRILIVQQRS
ncbi:hypothetical protein M569_07070, partial [Genlisea aurea]